MEIKYRLKLRHFNLHSARCNTNDSTRILIFRTLLVNGHYNFRQVTSSKLKAVPIFGLRRCLTVNSTVLVCFEKEVAYGVTYSADFSYSPNFVFENVYSLLIVLQTLFEPNLNS